MYEYVTEKHIDSKPLPRPLLPFVRQMSLRAVHRRHSLLPLFILHPTSPTLLFLPLQTHSPTKWALCRMQTIHFQITLIRASRSSAPGFRALQIDEFTDQIDACQSIATSMKRTRLFIVVSPCSLRICLDKSIIYILWMELYFYKNNASKICERNNNESTNFDFWTDCSKRKPLFLIWRDVCLKRSIIKYSQYWRIQKFCKIILRKCQSKALQRTNKFLFWQEQSDYSPFR